MTINKQTIEVYHPLDAVQLLDVELLETPNGPVLIIGRHGNKGPNIASVMDHYIPQLISRFNLNIKDVRVVYRADNSDDNQDYGYHEVKFTRELRKRVEGSSIKPYVKLQNPPMTSLSPHLVVDIEGSGYILTKYTGDEVIIQSIEDGDVKCKVDSYNGTSYSVMPEGRNNFITVRGKIKTVTKALS